MLDQAKDLDLGGGSSSLFAVCQQGILKLNERGNRTREKLNEHILVEAFGDGYIEKWKVYYERGLNGEPFEIEEHFYNPNTNQV